MRPLDAAPSRGPRHGLAGAQSANPPIRQSVVPPCRWRPDLGEIRYRSGGPGVEPRRSSSSSLEPHQEIREIRASTVPGLREHSRDLAHHPTELLPPPVPVQLDGPANHRVLSILKTRLTEGNEPHLASRVPHPACCMLHAACCMLHATRSPKSCEDLTSD
jgi:hypothetical protein